MIDCVYFTEHVRCYRDGRVERIHKQCKTPKWNVVPNKANNGGGYNLVVIGDKRIYRHRIIAFCFHGLDIDDLTQKVDHINRDTIDNSAENLRIVTAQQNQFNRGAKGYWWRKDAGKWEAKIRANGRQISLGVFVEEADARQAYLDAKAIHHVIP
jgi:hypothetical protein